MKRSVISMVVIGGLSFGAIGSAAADVCATTGRLTVATGSVLVDRGSGFVPGVIGASLKGGDKIAVRGQGNAVVDFGNNRTLTIPGSTTEVVRVPGCGLIQTNSGSIGPTAGIFGTLALTGGIAAAISTTEGKSGVIVFPVSP